MSVGVNVVSLWKMPFKVISEQPRLEQPIRWFRKCDVRWNRKSYFFDEIYKAGTN